jgi:septal ring factor EnvC (AmiA/AmiB activator)
MATPQISLCFGKIMKTDRKWVATVALCLAIGMASALAQTNITPAAGTRVGKIVVPDAPANSDAITTVIRPSVTERPTLPPEVLERIQRFRKDAQAYLDKEQAIKKKLQGANDQERAKLREELGLMRQKLLEQQRQLREEFRDRLSELRSKLQDRSELFDSLRDAAASARGGRDRRGGER